MSCAKAVILSQMETVKMLFPAVLCSTIRVQLRTLAVATLLSSLENSSGLGEGHYLAYSISIPLTH